MYLDIGTNLVTVDRFTCLKDPVAGWALPTVEHHYNNSCTTDQ